MFSNKLFHFSYEILNVPSEKISFLWNFCHLFPVLFYEWNTSINDSYQFLGFFLRIISWKEPSLFNGLPLLPPPPTHYGKPFLWHKKTLFKVYGIIVSLNWILTTQILQSKVLILILVYGQIWLSRGRLWSTTLARRQSWLLDVNRCTLNLIQSSL